jgi:glycosyltransferase involved in cell wall biosynthesis
MNIAYISGDRGVPIVGRSGSSIHVREFVHALVARRMGVTILTACPADGSRRESAPCPMIDLTADPMLQQLRQGVANELEAVGRASTRASETYGLLLNQTLLQELTCLRGRIDVVYERLSLWSFAGLQFARREGLPFFLEINVPLVAQQREYRDLDMLETARAIEGLMLSKADRVIATSSALRDYARARGAAHVRIIPCGVSPQMFPESGRLGCGDNTEFVIGFVGSLKPWHGVDILLDAFAQLSALSPQYRLLVVGDGPLMPDVQAFCRRHALSDRVTLVGSVDHTEVPSFLAQMDVGVAPYPPLPAFYFSPLKVWEYAAAGVPIVASASGDLPQLFAHRFAALLHPPGNLRKIVKHVEKLRHDRGLGQRLARRARRVAQRHTWDRLARRFESLANHVIAANAGRTHHPR